MNGVERKRVTVLDQTLAPLQKKQRVSSTAPSSDNEDKDPTDFASNLENFRKEAIWREMEEFRRKFERAQRTVDSLETERRRCEARLSAVDYSWNLLVQEADLLLPSTSTAPNGHSHSASSPPVSDPSLNDDELETALAQRSSATKALLGRLRSLYPSDPASSEKVDELQQGCRALLESSLRSQEALRLLRVQHDSTVEQLESTHTALIRAEKRYDRLQSATVAQIEGRSLPSTKQSSPVAEGSKQQPTNGVTPKVEEVAPQGPSSQELEELTSLLQARARDIEELRHDRVTLKMDLDALKAKLVELPDEIVAESIPFRLLQGHVQSLTVEYESKRLELDRVSKEADAMREMQESFREMVFKEAGEQVEEVQKRLVVKEGDLTRIRAQREELRAESTELRAKELEKVKNLDQLKVLASSREDRIVAYESEVRRLKMQIAAAKGDTATVELLGTVVETDIVNDLQARLKSAEGLLLALRDQLRTYSSNCGTFDASTIARSETDARLELSACKSQLEKLQALVGPAGNVEVRDLVERLRITEEKVKVLEAQLVGEEHSTNMLYGEIDRLSAAWSTLDEQNSSKVFNLVSLEEKVQRLNTDKAKADNRYFATLRQKDAIAAENAVLTKLAEKQQRAVDSANEVQHGIGLQLTAAEREITAHQKNVRAHQDAVAGLRRENVELGMRNEQNVKHITELNSLLADRISQAESEIAARKRMEEQVGRADRELRAAKANGPSSTGGSAESRELKNYNDDLLKMLKCSNCNLRFKGVIINRCGHLFCKECIQTTLDVRARKCPTCGGGFSATDVCPVYF